ncbi:serine protease grass-like [Drosophila rhopaloa]|uniref:Peptidase S1 domain-containing protein n=1 Tax=Drosophila rhopaloa TaxID=1041015 RepID=A0ABM5J256_DRORH|nr:serine protease grass-like [Drosophila rhopaloa]
MFGNPWMAFIQSSILCGGSLITNRFVLTAAHCRSNTPAVVYLGEFDRSTITDCSTTACMPNAIGIHVDAQIGHPSYSTSGHQNDIALFRLARPVQYTDYIRPICLLTNFDPLPQIRTFTATGWGETGYSLGSNKLLTATLMHVDRSYCSIYGRVDSSQICVAGYDSHVCRGDSGGPLMATVNIKGANRVIQAGVVSYGHQNCRHVSVFTNVVHHINWIADVVRRGSAQNTQFQPKVRRPTYSYYPNTYWYIYG